MNNRVIGTAVVALGAVIAALGLALIVVLGPDGRFTTGPHRVNTTGIAVVTAPTVIGWKNVQIEILAEVPGKKPIFVGVANSVDMQAYLKGVRRLEITSFETPWTMKTRQADGRNGLPGAPTAVDWWRASSAGLGGAAIKTGLPDETVSAAVLAVGSSNLRGLEVTLAYGIRGAFLKGLGLLLAGAGIAWAGVLARRGESLWERTDDSDADGFEGDESPTEIIPRLRRAASAASTGLAADPVVEPTDEEAHEGAGGDVHDVEVEEVYVYVDEDGVEHEISAEEAAQYEVVEVAEIEGDDGAEPDDPDVDDAEPEGTGEAHPTSVDEPVSYFWVDEDGVEHEVSADELHEFEFPDQDDNTPEGKS